MSLFVAFLRGINVGGRRVSGNDLRTCLGALGLTDVTTFRASGNVVFTADGGSEDELTARIEKALAKSLGYEVPVFLRSGAEVRAIAGHEPFSPAEMRRLGGKLQVSLLPAAPPAAARKKVLGMATDEDRLAIRGRELYWLPSGGIMKTALDLDGIEKLIGPSTRRTKGVIEDIAVRYCAART
jgi:uncharacterized protein (DUF1697 family)